MMMITSSYKVNALEYDNITFPDFPNDGYDSYVLYYASGSYNDGIPYGYNLVKFNKDDVKYLHYIARGSVQKLTLSKDFCFENCTNYDVTADEDYKIYNYNKTTGEWDIKSKTSGRNYLSLSIHTIFISNVNIYSDSETYENSKLYKDSNGSISYTFKYLTSDYSEFTINPPTSLEDIKNHIVYSPKENLIKFEDNIVDDLDNRSVNLLKVNFNDIYDDNYKYLISFDNKNWIDVSDTIFSNKEHYIIYDLMANTTIYAKVLNQDNEELALSSKVINNLNDYQLIKSVSSTDTLNIYSVDYRIKNIQNTMGYEHYTTKIKLQYGSYDQTNKNRPYYLDYSITGLDNDGMELDIDLTDYYDVKIENKEYYQGDYESFLYYDLVQKKSLLPNEVKQLKVSFYFTNLDNYYIHCYTTNTKSQTEIRFTESMFKDYVLYYFESGYDYALIRPKSFTTSSGSLISDAYYFNSGILEMTTYDFINNQISTIFDKTMNRKDYLIEGNNLKFDFKSDEDNKVYPALFLRKETYCNLEISYQNLLVSPGFTLFKCLDSKKRLPKALFYVHKDFYVQYINRETLETKVVNVDKDEFEEKNNLELTKDFQDKINDKYNNDDVIGEIKDNESFFKTLSKAFDRFKSNLSVILGDLNYFFNSLSTDYKYYFYVIFGLTLFGIVIRFIL